MNFAHSAAYRVSAWNRSRKWKLFNEEIRPTPATRILDVGFQDRAFQEADNYIEQHHPWPEQLTALGIVEPEHFSKRYPEVDVVVYDGVDFPFEDGSFDVVWSNAVLEHVGDRGAQRHFLSECRRVGKRLFLTTPNRRFPIEVHTRLPLLHWLPKGVFDQLLTRAGMSRFAGDYMNLLSAKDLDRLLNEAGVPEYRLFRNRLAGLTLDFVVIA